MKTTIDVCPKCGEHVDEGHDHSNYGWVDAEQIEVEYDPTEIVKAARARLAAQKTELAKRRAEQEAERARWKALTPAEQEAEDPERFEIQEATKDMSQFGAMDYILKRVWAQPRA